MQIRPHQLIGVVLILAGLLALIFRGFSYTKETHDAKFGPLKFEVEEKKQVDIPVWAGAAAVIIGTGFLLIRRQD